MIRDAFKSALIYEHRSASTHVSTLAFDSSKGNVYLGLNDGHLEEYAITLASGNKLHLAARKRISSKVKAHRDDDKVSFHASKLFELFISSVLKSFLRAANHQNRHFAFHQAHSRSE